MEAKKTKQNQPKKGTNVQQKKQSSEKKTKNNVVKKSKGDNKNVSKKQQETKQVDKTTKKITTDSILMIVFVSLLILVIVLGILVFIKSKNNVAVNMVIPIIEKDSEIEFSIDLASLKKEKDYVFKIVNYRNEEVISENIPYTITIENNTNSKIKLTRNDAKNNLMKKQSSTTLDSLKMYKNEKEEIYFHITFEKVGKIKEKDLVNIKIKS